ncbi:MAG: cell division protein ZapA [Acetobacteraceae bacterium]|jgi:cell division protein ZapA|nr:cell division protein ZapA [Acetobacteraceae bacterium]
MAQVTLRINGYAYTLGCQDGEEKHLEAMGAEVSQRIDGVRLAAGPSGEARMLVMAALLMADDIFELRAKLQAAESATGSAATTDPKLGRKLSRMAKRAEEIAEGLETK